MANRNYSSGNPVARAYRNYEYQYEVSGNTVRQTAVPVYEPDEEVVAPVRRPKKRTLTRQEQKKLQRAKAFNLPSVIVIAIFMVAAAYSCMSLVGAQGELNKHLREVKILNNELSILTERNDLRLSEVEAGINYTSIYEYAITQLGMKQPGKDQVVWYDSTESEYVVQYENIPKE